jgi:hypothetical protein
VEVVRKLKMRTSPDQAMKLFEEGTQLSAIVRPAQRTSQSGNPAQERTAKSAAI